MKTGQSGFSDLLHAPPNVSAAWNAFSLFVVGATPVQATGAFADHALGVYLSGRHRIRREMAGRPVEGWSDPGTVNFSPANVKATWQASGRSRAIVLLIPDAFLSRVISEHWEADPRNVELIPQFLRCDFPGSRGAGRIPIGTTVCGERVGVPRTSLDPLVFNTLGASPTGFSRPPGAPPEADPGLHGRESCAAHRAAPTRRARRNEHSAFRARVSPGRRYAAPRVCCEEARRPCAESASRRTGADH